MAGSFHGSSSLGVGPTTTNPAFTGSSSSSILAAPFKPELDSSETDNKDDEDFFLELTRQMEDYMLQEDDDHNINHNNKNTPVECFVSHNSIPKVKDQNQKQNQNEHRVVENTKRGRRWKMTESTQQMKYYKGRRVTSSGSGMRAVFLNRPGSETGYNGTGVFLPPSANNPTAQRRKIPGCSAALVPSRVLQALEQHFNNLKSLSPLNNLLKTESTHQGRKIGMQQKPRWTLIDRVENELPQEWTY